MNNTQSTFMPLKDIKMNYNNMNDSNINNSTLVKVSKNIPVDLNSKVPLNERWNSYNTQAPPPVPKIKSFFILLVLNRSSYFLSYSMLVHNLSNQKL